MKALFFTPNAQVLIARLARSKWVIRPLIDHLDHSTYVISKGAFGVKKVIYSSETSLRSSPIVLAIGHPQS